MKNYVIIAVMNTTWTVVKIKSENPAKWPAPSCLLAQLVETALVSHRGHGFDLDFFKALFSLTAQVVSSDHHVHLY